MKVGVLTYHSANNYGTCLQCYALMHLVEQAGYDCDVIDYRGEAEQFARHEKGTCSAGDGFLRAHRQPPIKAHVGKGVSFLPSKAFSSQPACDGKRFAGARQAV